MASKINKIMKHVLYIIVSNTVFGVVYYFVFKWLAVYSILYAYLGSLALIVIGLLLDNSTKTLLASKKLIEDLKKLNAADRRKNHRFIQWLMDSFVSFKTVLLIFYFLILIVSQIINLHPTIFDEDIRNFVFSNIYGIVLLISLERIFAQFSKDKEEMNKIAETFNKDIGNL